MARASAIMGRIATNVKHLGQIFLVSEPILWWLGSAGPCGKGMFVAATL
jgi:hypothetical protein